MGQSHVETWQQKISLFQDSIIAHEDVEDKESIASFLKLPTIVQGVAAIMHSAAGTPS